MTWNISTIVAEVFYCIIGLIFIATGMKALKDEAVLTELQLLFSGSSLHLPLLQDLIFQNGFTGLCVVFLAILTAFKTCSPKQKRYAKRGRNPCCCWQTGLQRIYPTAGTGCQRCFSCYFLKVLGANNAIGISGSIALVTAFIFFRPKAVYAVKDCTRLTDNVGVTGILPQVLAALGSVFTAAGVGDVIAGA